MMFSESSEATQETLQGHNIIDFYLTSRLLIVLCRNIGYKRGTQAKIRNLFTEFYSLLLFFCFLI